MGRRTSPEDVLDQKDGIRNINSSVTIRVTLAERIRGRAVGEDVLDQKYCIRDVDTAVTIGIATVTWIRRSLITHLR